MSRFFSNYFYPLSLMIGFLLSLFLLFVLGINQETAVGVSVFFALACAYLSEKRIPYNRNIETGTSVRDSLYTVVNMIFLMLVGPTTIVFFAVLLRVLLGERVLLLSNNLGPIYLQTIIVILFVDLGRYWIHRAQHRYDWLWKFHSQHHSIKRVYSGNNFYSHPLDLFVRHGVPGYIASAIGFDPIAIGVGLSVLALIGIFSHCDADFNLGFLNKFITTNQVHRWHHSSQFGAEGRNYAPALCFWDRVFGSYYLESKAKGPADMGLGEYEKDYPVKDMWAYTLYPFLRQKKSKG